MTKTFKKPRLFSNNFKQKPKTQIENNQPQLPPNLHPFKRNYYQEVVFQFISEA